MAVKYHDIQDQGLIARIWATQMSVLGDHSLPVDVRGGFIFLLGASEYDAVRGMMRHTLPLGELKDVMKLPSSEVVLKQIRLLENTGCIEVTVSDDQVSYGIPLKQEKEAAITGV